MFCTPTDEMQWSETVLWKTCSDILRTKKNSACLRENSLAIMKALIYLYQKLINFFFRNEMKCAFLKNSGLETCSEKPWERMKVIFLPLVGKNEQLCSPATLPNLSMLFIQWKTPSHCHFCWPPAVCSMELFFFGWFLRFYTFHRSGFFVCFDCFKLLRCYVFLDLSFRKLFF